MLSVLERCQAQGAFEFIAVAPGDGPLAGALAAVDIEVCAPEFLAGKVKRSRRNMAGQLRDVVEKITPDLLHANSLSMGRLTGSIAAGTTMPCTSHLRDILRLSQAAVHDLNGNRRLIAVSEATRDYHIAQGVDPHRTLVAYNGVNCQVFRPRPGTGQLRLQTGLQRDAFLILSIGQIGLRKGLDVVADAAEMLKDDLPCARFLIVGERHSNKDESVEFERRLVERLTSDRLLGRVQMLGRCEDVAGLMNEADLLLHAAHQEPLGRVLLEAAASGLPVLATNVGGTPEIFEDRVSAWLVRPGRAAELAQAIHRLATDADMRLRLAESARRRIERQFCAEAAAKRHSKIWREVMATTP